MRPEKTRATRNENSAAFHASALHSPEKQRVLALRFAAALQLQIASRSEPRNAAASPLAILNGRGRVAIFGFRKLGFLIQG